MEHLFLTALAAFAVGGSAVVVFQSVKTHVSVVDALPAQLKSATVALLALGISKLASVYGVISPDDLHAVSAFVVSQLLHLFMSQ